MKDVFGIDLISDYIVYEGTTIGKNCFFGHWALVRQNCVLGDNVSVGSNSEVANGCMLENNVRIHSQCFIAEYSVLREKSWIGPKSQLINDMYPQSNNKNKRSPIIEKGAIIGANCTIMPGVVIGENALVGAGSVVTKSVPADEVWVGNPAKYLKKRSDLDAYSAL